MSDVREPLAEEELRGKMAPEEEEIAEPFEPYAGVEEELPRRVPRQRRPPSIFWPLVLIGTGVILLLWNLNYLPEHWWIILWRFWPVLLIAIGIEVLFGRRSTIGAIISALLIVLLAVGVVLLVVYADQIPAVAEWIEPPEVHTEPIVHSLEGVDEASVYIDWSSAPGYLSALRDSPNLIEGEITLSGDLIFDADTEGGQAKVSLDSESLRGWFWVPSLTGSRERWDVQLSPEVPIDLTLDAGSGPYDFDLTGLQMAELFLDAGSGPVELVLPSGGTFDVDIDAGSGPIKLVFPSGSNLDVAIDGGSGPITIVLPGSVGARVELDAGSGPFNTGGRLELVEGERRGDGVWETDNYRRAEYKIVLQIDQGSGPITIVEE